MAYSPLRARKIVHRQMKRLGGRNGAIVRDGNPTPIFLRVMDYTSRDRRGDLTDPLARRAIISMFAPDGSEMTLRPDKETDRIIARPSFIEVAGVIVMWDLQVLE
jgi:hypothetical protein